MSSAAYEQYRNRLTGLTSDSLPLRAIAEAGRQQAWWTEDYAWRRTYGRFHPGHASYVTLVYETVGPLQEMCRIDISEARPQETGTAAPLLFDDNVGWLCVTRFPSDPVLPTLGAVIAASGHHKIVRYRPYRRCTLRVENGEHVRFAKVYPDTRGEQVHRAGLALWHAACEGELGFLVAQPDRWDDQTRTLWQVQIPGTPVITELLSSEGIKLAHRLGEAAASLTVSHVVPEEVFDGAVQFARSERYGQELSQRVPQLAPQVDALLARLSEIHATVGPRQLRPIHGAPHANQWLSNGAHLGLVDFDRISWGDPELDVATFLAEMDFERQLQVPIERLEEAFLAGYSSVAGSLDRRLLVAYRAHKRLAKALRSARAVRPDGDLRSERDLLRASQCLEGDLE